MARRPRHARRTYGGGALLALVGLAMLLGAPPRSVTSAPETSDVAERIQEAKTLELTHEEFVKARLIYESLLLPATEASLSPAQRGDVLAGQARCAKREGKTLLAETVWQTIVAEPDLPAEVRAYAAEELKTLRARTAPSRAELEAERTAQLEAQRKQQRREAEALVARAQNALDQNAYERAYELVLRALVLNAAHPRAQRLLGEIQAARPDQGTLLRQLMEFVQTRALAEWRSLDRTLDELEEAGRAAMQAEAWSEADRRFRDAIHRLDSSGFLEIGVARPFFSHAGRRARLVTWLTQAHELGAKSDLRFAAIPDAPVASDRTPGLEGQLYGLLARLFQPQVAGEEPLRFYPFTGRHGSRGTRKPLLTSQFEGPIRPRQEPGTLTRARWAERWIERAMNASWLDPTEPGAAAREASAKRRGARTRILARFGDVVAVQHREPVHRRVEGLQSAFAATPPPLHVDVHVFAAGTGGGVRVAEALALTATKGTRGYALTHRGELVEQCVEKLSEVEGLLALGHLQLQLHDTSAAKVHLERLTSEHPMFAGMRPPALLVPADLLTYGLTLDLYAEDLPHASSGLPRSALSLIARTTMPTHAPIVPRKASGEARFARLPAMGRHAVEADVELPHFGTFVLLGLPNPFPPSNMQLHELILVMGVRRADDPIPDAPPQASDPRVVPGDDIHREHDLGSLAVEVRDHTLRSGWPEHAPADEAETADRIAGRNRWLARWLAQKAGLQTPDDDPAASAVTVHEGRAGATADARTHRDLAAAALALQRQADRLYRIDVTSAIVPREQVADWSRLPGVLASAGGGLRLNGEITPRVKAALSELRTTKGLFALEGRAYAAPTQRAGLRRTEDRSLVRDLRVDTFAGRTRTTPVLDRVSQGLVVQVRPGLDQEGQRSVRVRARAARWDAIERAPHPEMPGGEALVDVPRWLPGDAGALVDRQTNDILGDHDALLLTLPYPGDTTRTIAVLVQVTGVL